LPFSGIWGPVYRPTPVPNSLDISTNTNGFDSSSFGNIGYGFPTFGSYNSTITGFHTFGTFG
jgi:hypothetical protein